MAVTIRDIAEYCQVSVATVSKALNGYDDISQATRERVRQAVAELGYLPNAHAQALKTHRSYNLGVLLSPRRGQGLRNSFFAGILSAFQEEAAREGYDITFISQSLGRRTANYLEHCYYRHVDGVCIAAVDFSDPGVLALIGSSIPVVTIDYLFPDTDAVLSDNRKGMMELIGYIHAMGHRRIGYLHGQPSFVTDLRIDGMITAMEQLGCPVQPSWIRQGDYHNPDATARLTSAWLEEADAPTCLIVSDDYSAIGARQAILERGMRIPEDISLAGFDGIDIAGVFTPPLTTVWQDTQALGTTAAKGLIARINGLPREGPQPVWIPTRLVPGASIGKVYPGAID